MEPLTTLKPTQARVEREVDILREATSLIESRLPSGWKTNLEEQLRLGGTLGDGLIRIKAPDGSTGTLVVEAKRLIVTRDVPQILSQLERMTALVKDREGDQAGPTRDRTRKGRSEAMVPLVVARYLSPSTREALERLGASYADMTGNIRVQLQEPALFIRDVGAQQDPWRGPGRPRGTLKGSPAARVVRALVDFAPPLTVPDLVVKSRASTGATYRVIEFLAEEGLLTRERSRIVEVDWPRLLERWSKDYGFTKSNLVRTYLSPRGLDAMADSLRKFQDLQYVLTGSLAAEQFARYAPARMAMIYVEDPLSLATAADLREVEGGANVLLATTKYDVVYERSREIEGLRMAAPSQVAVDLMTGPGRNPTEAEELIRWMISNEPNWRL